ncbi:MAG: luciferase family protein [Chloroflexota bacterium]
MMNWRLFSLLLAFVGIFGLYTACQTTPIEPGQAEPGQTEPGQAATVGNDSPSEPKPAVEEPKPTEPLSVIEADVDFAPLLERTGPRTRTSGVVPHVQIDVEPVQAVNDELHRLAFALPGVENRPTIASLPGARGMWLGDGVPVVRPEVIVAGREFAHIHPDGSLHAPLPYERALEAVENGWAERHPWADQRDGWEGFVMLFTPQSMEELDVTFQLIVESYNHVTGQTVQASDFTN